MKSKIKSRPQIIALAKSLHRQKRKIAFTNGCFDLLHLGHVRYLHEAKKRGDVLIVGLNSDASVRKLKGKGRPLNPQKDRAEVLAALQCVDYLTIFAEETPEKLISLIKPDIHVKGGDYQIKDLPEAKIVRSYGGTVVVVKKVPGKSTTGMIRKIGHG